MAQSETGHHANASYVDQDGDFHLNGSTFRTDETSGALTAAELNYLDGLTAGTVTASKAVVVDSNKDISAFRNVGAAGTITSTGATSGIGYATGAGGTVTQATSITTGVTLNKVVGEVVTVSSTLAAAAEATFTVTNSAVAAHDGVVAWIKSTSSAGTPVVFVTAVAAGSFNITISNLHASAALDNTLTIGFAVLKGVVA